MDIWPYIAGAAVIVTIVAGVIQVIDYLQKSAEKKRKEKEEQQKVSQSVQQAAAAPKVGELPAIPSIQYPLLVHFETTGEYNQALQWITDSWSSLKSWDLLAHYMHFAVLHGDAAEGLQEYARLRETLTGQPPEELEHAIRYYDGRMRGQHRWIADALNLHRQNLSSANNPSMYQLKSSFEIAQLAYQVEDFKTSKAEFGHLLEHLENLPQGNWSTLILPRVLNYLGTLEMIHVVYDLPFSQVQSGDWQIGKAAKCLEYAYQSYHHVSQTNNLDLIAWALVTRAFGLEGVAAFDKADEEYLKSRKILENGAGQRTSLLYIMLYHAGFYRRRLKFDEARKVLDDALARFPSNLSTGYNPWVYEHLALLAEKKGEPDAAREFFTEAMQLHSKDKALQTRVEWPLVHRLRLTCEARKLDFNHFFRA